MIRAALLCLLALPAMAQDRASWGIPASRQSSVQIIATNDGAHVATVMAVNGMNKGTLDLILATVAIDGLVVSVHVDQGAGVHPDRYAVQPPDGFVAVPVAADVAEGDRVEFLIYRLDAMPMG